MQHDFRPHVRRAAKIVGGQTKLAQRIGTVQSEISRLCTEAQSISPETAIAISRATRNQVRLQDLIPHIVKAVAAEMKIAS